MIDFGVNRQIDGNGGYAGLPPCPLWWRKSSRWRHQLGNPLETRTTPGEGFCSLQQLKLTSPNEGNCSPNGDVGIFCNKRPTRSRQRHQQQRSRLFVRLSMDTREMVAESNRIEGIQRPPTDAEIIEHERFVRLKNLSVSEIENYVRIYQPNARLRSMRGLNVIVGAHTPPAGGNLILAHLRALVTDINAARVGAWDAHLRYETLHPFRRKWQIRKSDLVFANAKFTALGPRVLTRLLLSNTQ